MYSGTVVPPNLYLAKRAEIDSTIESGKDKRKECEITGSVCRDMFWHYGELLSRQHGRSLGILLFACALLAGSTESYSNSRPGHKRVPSGSNRAKVQDFEYAQSIDGDSTSMQVEAEPITSRRTLMTSMAMTCLMVSMSESANAQGLRQEATPSSLPTEIVAADAAGADTIDLSGILQKAWRKALGGGKAGASASVVQVLSLMWLRTSMNYQYRYGGKQEFPDAPVVSSVLIDIRCWVPR